MGGKTGTSTSSTTIPDDVIARYDSVNSQAQTAAQTPFQQYSTDPNSFVAPLNSTQQSGIQNTNNYANYAQPNINQATGMVNSSYDDAVGLYNQSNQTFNNYANQSQGAMQNALANEYNGMSQANNYYSGAQSTLNYGYNTGNQLLSSAISPTTSAYSNGLAGTQAAYNPLNAGYAQGQSALNSAYNPAYAGYAQGLAGTGAAYDTSSQAYGSGLAGTQAALSPANSAYTSGINGTNAAGNTINQANTAGNYYNSLAYNPIANATGQSSQLNNAAVGLTGQGLGQASGYNNMAGSLIGAGAQAVNPSQLNQSAINQYMNPYMNDVVSSQMALMNQQNQQQQNQLTGNAVASGAFGGDRAGVAQANLAQQQGLANNSVLSGLLSSGYNTALNTAEGQQAIGLSAGQANRSALQNAEQQAAGLGSQVFGQNLAAGQQLSNIGQNAYSQNIGQGQALAGLGQNAYNYNMGAGQAQAQLANQGYNMGMGLSQNEMANAQQQYAMGQGQAQMEAGLGQQAFNMGQQQSSTLSNLGQAQYNMGQSDASTQAALANQQYSMGIGEGQALSSLGQAQNNMSVNTANAQTNVGQNYFQDQNSVSNLQNQQAQQLAALGQSAAGVQQATAAGLFNSGQSAATNLANLGLQGQQAGLSGAQAQMAAGQVQQQTQQAGLTALYNQFLQQQSYPFQTAQFLANIAEGTGSLSGSTTTSQYPMALAASGGRVGRASGGGLGDAADYRQHFANAGVVNTSQGLIDPYTYSMLLQAQEQQYANTPFGQAGLYGATPSSMPGKSGYVPQPTSSGAMRLLQGPQTVKSQDPGLLSEALKLESAANGAQGAYAGLGKALDWVNNKVTSTASQTPDLNSIFNASNDNSGTGNNLTFGLGGAARSHFASGGLNSGDDDVIPYGTGTGMQGLDIPDKSRTPQQLQGASNSLTHPGSNSTLGDLAKIGGAVGGLGSLASGVGAGVSNLLAFLALSSGGRAHRAGGGSIGDGFVDPDTGDGLTIDDPVVERKKLADAVSLSPSAGMYGRGLGAGASQFKPVAVENPTPPVAGLNPPSPAPIPDAPAKDSTPASYVAPSGGQPPADAGSGLGAAMPNIGDSISNMGKGAASWAKNNQDWLYPLTQFIGGMHGAYRLGPAIVGGIGAAGKAEQDIQNQEIERQSAAAHIGQTNVGTANSATSVTPYGLVRTVIDPTTGQPRRVTQAEYEDMTKKFGKEPLAYLGGGSDGSINGAPTNFPKLIENAAAPQGNNQGSSGPISIPGHPDVNYDGLSKATAAKETGYNGNPSYASLQDRSNSYYKDTNASYDTAIKSGQLTGQLASEIADLEHSKGLGVAGSYYTDRAGVARLGNTLSNFVGADPHYFGDGDDHDTIIHKLAGLRSQAMTSDAGQHAYAAVEQALTLTPNGNMSPGAAADLTASILTGRQQDVDRKYHMDQYMADSPANTAIGASADFARTNSDKYQQDRLALKQLIMNHPDNFKDLMNGNYTPQQIQKALSQGKYDPSLYRYFTQAR
jgi:hypothetical protein